MNYYNLVERQKSDYGWLESCRNCGTCNFTKVRETAIVVEYRCRTKKCNTTTLVYKAED